MSLSRTERHRQILRLIGLGILEEGRAPSGLSLAAETGVSTVTVYKDLQALSGRGLVHVISGGSGVPLKVRLSERGRTAAGLSRALPRFGRIPAGPLTDVVSQADDFVSGLSDLMPWIQDGDYLLEVEGDSMEGAGLRAGMTLVMRPGVSPSSGDICSAHVEGAGNTLKRVFLSGGTIELRPENPSYGPQRYPAEQVSIQGVLVGALDVLRFR